MIRMLADFGDLEPDGSLRWPAELVVNAAALRIGAAVELHDTAGTTARGIFLGADPQRRLVVKVAAGSVRRPAVWAGSTIRPAPAA
jgi:hypothetical protein